jgi:hypothetical protein
MAEICARSFVCSLVPVITRGKLKLYLPSHSLCFMRFIARARKGDQRPYVRRVDVNVGTLLHVFWSVIR